MTRRAFLQKYALRFAVTLAMLGLIVYTVAHATGFAVGSILTTPTRLITDTQLTSSQAYLFRNEEVLTTDHVGLVDALVESGVKVGKNVSVAQVWSVALSGEALETAQLTLNRINRALRILENSTVKPGTTVSQAEKYYAEAMTLYREIGSAVQEGRLEKIPSLEERFLIALNRYAALTGKTESTEALQSELRGEKNALLQGASSYAVKSERSSGIYYGTDFVDGYEGTFTVDALQSLTPSRLDALVENEPAAQKGQTIGKMVYGYEWYVALELSPSVAEGFRAGRTYQINFPDNEDRTLSLTLERMSTEGDRVLAIFRSDEHPTDFVFYRVQTVEITVGESVGFYIPDAALREQNGAMGVYIFEESTVRFRRIEIVYRGDGYSIAALPGDDSLTELQENDILITSGKDLYEGKVYQ